jgi:nitrate reductase gamma subunit
MTDVLLFAAYPYVAVVLLVVISILRYRENAYTVSSLSSQFLESGKLFWGSVPFHLGILTVFLGHLIGFLFPRSVMAFASHPVRLLILEVSGLVAALLFGVGLVLLILRRLAVRRLRPVTTALDVAVYAILLFQVVTGLYVALFLRWGSAWYVNVAVPYLRSLLVFQPQVELMAGVPWMARLHVLGAFTLIAIFSFTRLVHVLVAPLPYLWRRPQLVLWYRDRKTVRKVEEPA